MDSSGSFSTSGLEKDQIMDCLYWIKQIVGLILGCVAGTMQLTGLPTMLGFCIIVSACSMFYTWQVVKAEEIEAWDIVTEAFGPCFFSFLLLWTLTYTFI